MPPTLGTATRITPGVRIGIAAVAIGGALALAAGVVSTSARDSLNITFQSGANAQVVTLPQSTGLTYVRVGEVTFDRSRERSQNIVSVESISLDIDRLSARAKTGALVADAWRGIDGFCLATDADSTGRTCVTVPSGVAPTTAVTNSSRARFATTLAFGTPLSIASGESRKLTLLARTEVANASNLDSFRVALGDTKRVFAAPQGSTDPAALPVRVRGNIAFKAAIQRAPVPVAASLTVQPSYVENQTTTPNVKNAVIGAFRVHVTGEPISFTGSDLASSTQMRFSLRVRPDQIDFSKQIEGIMLLRQGGERLAGSVPLIGNVYDGSIVFSEAITFPTGTTVVRVTAVMNGAFEVGDTIQVSTIPSTGWIGAKGDETGIGVIASPGETVHSAVFEIQASSAAIGVAINPPSSNVIAGATNVPLIGAVVSAAESGQNLYLYGLTLGLSATGNRSDIRNCALYDGDQALTLGSDLVNPLNDSDRVSLSVSKTGSDQRPVVEILRGSIKTFTVRCDISATATGEFTWELLPADAESYRISDSTGNTVSNLSVTPGKRSQTVVSHGGYTVSLDSSTPQERWVSAGSKGVALNVLRFGATGEDIAITNLRLRLDRNGSSSAKDFIALELWDGQTLVGKKASPAFTGGYEDFTFPTSGNGAFTLSKDSFKRITIKADLANIGAGASGRAGELVGVDYMGDPSENKGVGLQSGATIHSSAWASTNGSGVVYFRSVPRVEKVAVPTGILRSGANVLYRLKISADPTYDVAVRRLTFMIAKHGGATLEGISVSVLEDDSGVSFGSAPVSQGAGSYATITAGQHHFSGSHGYENGAVTIPAGATRTFEVRGVNLGTDGTTDSITTQFVADSARSSAISLVGPMRNTMVGASRIEEGTNNRFIWSDFSSDATTTHSLDTADWMNGFLLPGLQSGLLPPETLSN